MNPVPTSTHRTVALVGAAGAGKTTLAEALLLRAGAIPRAGSVEQGTTVSDHEPEEIARGTSLGLSLAHLTWQPGEGTTGTTGTAAGGECTITLADTPGRSDFVGSVDVALAVADVAVVVVSAVDGVTAGTRFVWSAADAVGLPRIVVITQEDKTRADFHRVLGELRAAFGDHLWPLELPLGEEQAFHGVADVLSEQALEYDESGRHHDGQMPADAEAEEHQMHLDVTEEIVSHDDEQLEAYLEGNEPSPSELERTLAREVASGSAVPVIVCSGVTGTGVDRVARPDLRAVSVRPRTRGTHRHRRGGEGRERYGCRDRLICPEGCRSPRRPEPRRRAAPCMSSAPWPTRSSDRSRCSKCSRAWCIRATGCTTPPPAPTSASTASSSCGAPSTCRSARCARARWAPSPN